MTLHQGQFVPFFFEKNELHRFDYDHYNQRWQAKILQKNMQKYFHKKVSICAYLGCSGRNFPPDANCCICGAFMHLECSPKVSMGDTTAYCSTNCIHFDHDDSNDNSKI
jgi:hypothetical protein